MPCITWSGPFRNVSGTWTNRNRVAKSRRQRHMAGVGSVQGSRGRLRWDRLRLHFRPPFLEPCACSRPIWFQSHSNWIRALMKQTLHMVVRFSPAESVMQVMTFQSHNQYPQLKESDAINDITAKTCQSETSTTNLNESFETCCLFFPASSTPYKWQSGQSVLDRHKIPIRRPGPKWPAQPRWIPSS